MNSIETEHCTYNLLNGLFIKIDARIFFGGYFRNNICFGPADQDSSSIGKSLRGMRHMQQLSWQFKCSGLP